MKLYSVPEYQEDFEKIYQTVPMIQRFQGKTILITGAGGMIGSFIVDFFMYCTEKKGFGCKVYGTGRCITKLSHRFSPFSEIENLQFLRYEMGMPIDWNYEELCAPDFLIHCAGSGSPSEFMQNPAKMIRDTVAGTYDLIEYVSKIGKPICIMTSSGEVYGKALPGTRVFTEESHGEINHISQRSCYPVAKKAAESLWLSYGRQTGMQMVIARLCHIYGPTAKPDESRIAGLCLSSALRAEDIVLKSCGLQRRSWCYVADCASGILTALLMGENGEAYNVAPDGEATIAELAQKTAGLVHKRVLFKLPSEAEREKFNPMDMCVLSAEKLKSIGWKALYNLDQGLERSYKIIRQALVSEAEQG